MAGRVVVAAAVVAAAAGDFWSMSCSSTLGSATYGARHSSFLVHADPNARGHEQKRKQIQFEMVPNGVIRCLRCFCDLIGDAGTLVGRRTRRIIVGIRWYIVHQGRGLGQRSKNARWRYLFVNVTNDSIVLGTRAPTSRTGSNPKGLVGAEF